METLNTVTFKEKIFDFGGGKKWKFAGQIPTIVDFYADWCGPCKMQAPVLEEIAKAYAGKVEVFKVNTEESPEVAALFRIRSIPSILFIPAEGMPSLSAGFLPKSSLKALIEEVLRVEDPEKKSGEASCCG